MWIRLAIGISILSPAVAGATTPTREELNEAEQWFDSQSVHRPWPFSFVYDGKASSVQEWPTEGNSGRDGRLIKITDPKTHLVVRFAGRHYADSPTVEWTISFTNEGTQDTPIIENVRAIDMSFDLGRDEMVLHHNTGDNATPDSYEPHADLLTDGETKTITATGGRPTQNVFPYFNFAG